MTTFALYVIYPTLPYLMVSATALGQASTASHMQTGITGLLGERLHMGSALPKSSFTSARYFRHYSAAVGLGGPELSKRQGNRCRLTSRVPVPWAADI